ncbi:hypothetical protein Rmag_0804 [Candidatus Ruthia magnifica str. Cm (Calyptogena magnifica)]|uniref:SoxXA-binding protein SoxK n=1 Tax=Ruthia magnifica subsp. Calyptogena magnifica TaxID=413404 RepID=A1AX68_RUTMC|nr:hypothetical protein [Candidatus Ruthturnera calyptogenae]ABL02525.1 hypothetical protein Rmag_0804 [Candidatus Ruthia magnifica str. Cm (Calyptogena magnifica)]
MKKVLLTILILFALIVQADFLDDSHNWNNGSSGSFKSVIKAAETDYKVNLAANMAWRDTEKMIKKAKRLYKAGKNAAAISLANKAHKQIINAIAQTELAKTAGPRF